MSVVDQGRVGELVGADGVIQPFRLTRKGGLAVTDVPAKYQEAVLRGTVYYLATGAAAPTAFVGAAGGTPLIGDSHSTGSGQALVLLGAPAPPTADPTADGVVS